MNRFSWSYYAFVSAVYCRVNCSEIKTVGLQVDEERVSWALQRTKQRMTMRPLSMRGTERLDSDTIEARITIYYEVI